MPAPALSQLRISIAIEGRSEDELNDVVVAVDPALHSVRSQIPIVGLARGESDEARRARVSIGDRSQIDARSRAAAVR